MENSKIEWTHHTFNPWIGCTKVSPGCAHCYAETLMDTRHGRVKWGKGQPRSRTGADNWRKPRQWNKSAAGAAERPRVFCASLADWLDDEVPAEWLADLLALIFETPHLDWLLLTKRPENFFRRIKAAWRSCVAKDVPWSHRVVGWAERGLAPSNVWIGTTVEDQTRADERIPELVRIPARVRFLSCEPMLGPVVLPMFCHPCNPGDPSICTNPERCALCGIDWVICGGESGPGARPMNPGWACGLRDQCVAAGVPFFFKQWGEWLPDQQNPEIGIPSGPTQATRVGKKAAGRMLDERTWDEFPAAGIISPANSTPELL